MLEHLGESRMTEYSVAVYGQPGDVPAAGATRIRLRDRQWHRFGST